MYNGISEEILTKTEDYLDGYKKGVEDSQIKKEKVKDILLAKESQNIFQKRLQNDYGGFYFNFYRRINIDGQFLFRFIYISSYINYDNYMQSGSRLIRENEVKGLLNLGNAEYYKTKKCLLENNLISIKDDFVVVNEKYCKKGTININKNIEVIRMFINAIQELYTKALPKEHKKLSTLISVLPYINYKYNIISYNPEETNIELIKPIKLPDLCEMLGYERSNASRLKRNLFSLRVNKEEVIGIFEKDCGKAIIVNPRVYYKGNSEDELNYLQDMFRIIN